MFIIFSDEVSSSHCKLIYCFFNFSIIVGMIFMRKRRDDKTREMTMPDRRVTQPPVSQLVKDVINPLAVEAGLDGDDDENTKTLQDLIQESQMK